MHIPLPRRRRRLGVALLLASGGCAGDEPPADPHPPFTRPTEQASDAQDLARLASSETPVSIHMPAGRHDLAGVVLSGWGIEVVGAGAEATTFVGPLRLEGCVECRVRGVSVVAPDRAAGTDALVLVTGGSAILTDMRVGSDGDGVAVGILADGADLRLEQVWNGGRTLGVRTLNGGGLASRHSVFESLEGAIERGGETELVLIDNLFADIRGCIVRDTVPDRVQDINTVFGNVRISPRAESGEAECLALPLLSPTDREAEPVLLELQDVEALRGSDALAALSRDSGVGR